jgi:hypothetical protein
MTRNRLPNANRKSRPECAVDWVTRDQDPRQVTQESVDQSTYRAWQSGSVPTATRGGLADPSRGVMNGQEDPDSAH